MGSKKEEKKNKRKMRVRGGLFGTKNMPRLSVFRSNKYIRAQLIDDESGKTLASAGDLELKTDRKKETQKALKKSEKAKKKTSAGSGNSTSAKTDKAYQVGQLLAKKAKKKRIKKVQFDRGSYKYHGRVKALAQGAREGGLKF